MYKGKALDDDNEWFCEMIHRWNWIKSYFMPGLSGFLTIPTIWHTASRTWACTEPELLSSYIKLWSIDFNPFHDNIPFLYLVKAAQNLWFSGVFRNTEMEHWREIDSIYHASSR